MTKYESISVKNEDEEAWEKFKELKWREKKSVSELIVEAAKEYLEHHAEGNPVYSLDKWQDPSFKATPAVFAQMENWKKYYEKLTKAEYKELDTQLNQLLKIHNQKVKML